MILPCDVVQLELDALRTGEIQVPEALRAHLEHCAECREDARWLENFAGDVAATRSEAREVDADALLGALEASRALAHAFNADGALRAECRRARLMGGGPPPDLVSQEAAAGRAAFEALEALDVGDGAYARLAAPRRLRLCRDLLREYAAGERAAAAVQESAARRGGADAPRLPEARQPQRPKAGEGAPAAGGRGGDAAAAGGRACQGCRVRAPVQEG